MTQTHQHHAHSTGSGIMGMNTTLSSDGHYVTTGSNQTESWCCSHSQAQSNHGEMKMYFHGGCCEAAVLFHFWQINTVPAMVGSCIGIFWLAVLYEALKVFREYLLTRTAKHCCQVNQCSGYNGTAAQKVDSDSTCSCDKKWRPHHPCGWPHLVQTGLHVVQVVLSYFLMLIFMSFNIWLCLSVVLGAGAGYMAFAWRRQGGATVESTEHCH